MVAESLASANAATGLTGVRQTYGLTGVGQTVAVIDTGMAYDHYALGGGLRQPTTALSAAGTLPRTTPTPMTTAPTGGHGTHVAGIVGGNMNGSVTDSGVAPGVDLVSLRVFDDNGNSYYSWVDSALQWVHDNRNAFANPITTVNLSLGSDWNASTIPSWATLESSFTQLEADGITITCSAGNSFTTYNSPGLDYPAASPHVIPVMSVDDNGSLSFFSQRSTNAIAAPGHYIISTVPDYLGNNNGIADDFASYSGTSMASPYIAGASVLVREAMQMTGQTNITEWTIYNELMNTADSFVDSVTGLTYKRLNMANAISSLLPSDDYGSTSSAAYDLGSLASDRSVSGFIGSVSDADYFKFVAATTGTVTITATANYDLSPTWTASGGTANGNTYTFQVTAGQTYNFGISTSQGIGTYDLAIHTVGGSSNQAPVLSAITNKTVNEGSLLTFTATATDADLPANTLTYSLAAGAPAGASINASTGVFSWTPTESQGGSVYNLTVVVTDNGAPALSDSKSFSVTVNEVNTAPVLSAIANKTVNEGSLLTFTATATDADLPANTLTYSLAAGAPAGASINASTGVFSWTPTESQGGSVYNLTVVVTDNGAPALSDSKSFSVTVNEVNTAPVLSAIANKTVNEGSLLTFTATATDADLPANTLTYSLAAGAPAGASINASTGVFSWTPTESQGGSVYNLTVVVTDNGSPALSDSKSFSVTVNEVNTAPVLSAIANKTVNEGSLLTFTATATDADLPANTLTYSLAAGAPAGASINASTGVFSWTPTESQGGSVYNLTVVVTDNGAPALSDSKSFSVTVNEVNTAPVLSAIANKTVNEGSLLTFTATATDADLPANTLTYSLAAGAPAGATINASTGVFSWTPTESQGGSVYNLTVVVTDNGAPALSDSKSFSVTVNEVNTAPVLSAIANKTVNEGSLLTFTATATDADLPANTLTYSLAAGAPAGASINASTGVFSWTPTESQGGSVYNLTVVVTDNGAPALSDSKSFSVTVNEVNTAPVLSAIANKTVNEGSLLTFTATATDADLPANTLTYSLAAGAPAGASINASTGVFSWTPTESQGGSVYNLTVVVTDNGAPALSDSKSFSVTVNEVNTAPVLSAIANKTVNEGSLLTFTATATDADLPANTLTYSLAAGAPAGASINASTGVFSWTPAQGQGGTAYNVTVVVSDNGAPVLTDSKTFSITVNDVNASSSSIWSNTTVPVSVDAGDGAAVNLGVKFTADTSGFITGIKFYKSVANTGVHTASLWSSSGQLLATGTFVGETASGWQTVIFSSPVAITAGTTYVASYFAPNGHYAVNRSAFATPFTSGHLTVSANGGVFTYGASSAFPTQSIQASNYWVDVVLSTTPPVDNTPPTVTSTSPANGATNAATSSAITIAFSEALNASTVTSSTVQLLDGATPVSASVTYNAANNTVTITPTAALANSKTYTISILGGTSGVKDVAGNALAQAFTSSFTTAAATVASSSSIWSNTTVPVSVDAGDGAAVNLGVKFTADTSGFITGIKFYKSVANTGVHTASLWSSSGQLLATGTFVGETASGWQTVIFSSPVAITAGTTYVASYFAPNGHYAVNRSAFNTPFTSGHLTVSANGGVFTYGTSSAFPTQSIQASNYWVDVVLSTTPPVDNTPPTVTSTSPAGGATNAATSSAITIAFSEALNASTVTSSTVQLLDGATPVSASVTYNAANNTVTITPTAALANSKTYTISILGGTSGVKDVAGNALAQTFTSSFTTAAATVASSSSIWSNTTVPVSVDVGEGTAVNLGVKFTADTSGFITGIKFYKSVANTGVHTASLWSSSGQLLATGTFVGETASGWQTVIFSSPVAITAGTTYVASYFAPNGHFSVNRSAFATPFTSGHLTVSANGGVFTVRSVECLPDPVVSGQQLLGRCGAQHHTARYECVVGPCRDRVTNHRLGNDYPAAAEWRT